jgi:hypothetical protein
MITLRPFGPSNLTAFVNASTPRSIRHVLLYQFISAILNLVLAFIHA